MREMATNRITVIGMVKNGNKIKSVMEQDAGTSENIYSIRGPH